jgi:hypothetical protein
VERHQPGHLGHQDPGRLLTKAARQVGTTLVDDRISGVTSPGTRDLLSTVLPPRSEPLDHVLRQDQQVQKPISTGSERDVHS